MDYEQAEKTNQENKEPECIDSGPCGARGIYNILKYDECHCEIWIDTL